MNSAYVILGEIATSTAISSVVATNVNADMLITALITFGVSLVTVVGGELIKFLVAYLKNKTKHLEKNTETIDNKDKQEDNKTKE